MYCAVQDRNIILQIKNVQVAQKHHFKKLCYIFVNRKHDTKIYLMKHHNCIGQQTNTNIHHNQRYQ